MHCVCVKTTSLARLCLLFALVHLLQASATSVAMREASTVYATLPRIEIDEYSAIQPPPPPLNSTKLDDDLAEDKLVANLTRLLLDDDDNHNLSGNFSGHLNRIEFYLDDTEHHEKDDRSPVGLFYIDHHLSLLKVSAKKRSQLDRETLCPPSSSSWNDDDDDAAAADDDDLEVECVLNVTLLVNSLHKIVLPIKVNDLNDMRPFFYQKQVHIDLNQNDFHKSDNSSLQRIPLKAAIDLDSSRKHRVLNYSLDASPSNPTMSSRRVFIKYENSTNQLDLFVVDDDDADDINEQHQTNLTFLLRAHDVNFSSDAQIIRIKLKSSSKNNANKFRLFEKNFFNFTSCASEICPIALPLKKRAMKECAQSLLLDLIPHATYFNYSIDQHNHLIRLEIRRGNTSRSSNSILK